MSDEIKYIIKTKVGRNEHLHQIYAEELEFVKEMYLKMEKCTLLEIYQLKEVVKELGK